MRTWARGVCMLLVALVCFSACAGTKTPLTADEFRTIMQDNGLEVMDLSADMMLEGDEVALYAMHESGLMLEFYVTADAAQAAAAFATHRQAFEEVKGNVSTEASLAGTNYQKYTLTSGGRFMVVCQVENTLLYVDTAEENKSMAQTLLKAMNY